MRERKGGLSERGKVLCCVNCGLCGERVRKKNDVKDEQRKVKQKGEGFANGTLLTLAPILYLSVLFTSNVSYVRRTSLL